MSEQPDPFGLEPRRERASRLRVVEPNEGPEPQASREAEEHVIACCLVDSGVTLSRCVREKIAVDSFYFPAPKKCYEVLLAMLHAAKPITLPVLAAELEQRREFDMVGGWPWLLQITNDVPTVVHVGYFIDQVRSRWVLRRLRKYGAEITAGVDEFTDGDLVEFAARHALRLQRVADFVTRLNRPAAAEETAAARAQLEQILAGKIDKSRQLSLGTPYADQVLLPMDVKNEDWMVVLCGPPSGGKSSVGRQIVGVNCQAGKCGAVFLLETGKRRWIWALAASFAQVSLREIMDAPHQLPKDRLKLFRDWEVAISGWIDERLWVFDDLYNIEDIERTARELDRTLREKRIAAGADPATARGLDFILGDYLQLMGTRKNIVKREELVAHVSRSWKLMCKAMDLTGVVLAQLNRRARDEERRPRLSDLRESGAIEQDADAVLAVHTPAVDRAGNAQDGERSVAEVELIALKRRNGPANLAIDLLFFKTQTRYQDAVRKGDLRPGQPKPAEGYKRPEEGGV